MPAHVACILHSLLRSLDRDVEMQDLFARAELLVERDGRVVAVIGLHLDDPAAARRCDFAQMPDQPRRDAPPGLFCDARDRRCRIRAALSRTCRARRRRGRRGSLRRSMQQGRRHGPSPANLQVFVSRRRRAIGFRVGEDVAEQGVQPAHERDVGVMRGRRIAKGVAGIAYI